MKIQTRLYLMNTLVFGLIFTLMMLITAGLYYRNSKKTAFEILKKTSYLTALFYLEEDEMNTTEFAQVRTQFKEEGANPFYQFYNEKNAIEFGSPAPGVAPEVLDKIRLDGKLAFESGDFYCYGIYYEDNQGNFVVITKEKKAFLLQQINLLLIVMAVALLVSIFAAFLLSRWMAKAAYSPFRRTIRQVRSISTDKLDVQIDLPQTGDELEDLVHTFNKLLSRISETFVIQRNFVSYISHEFRTPLASMQGNLEVFSLKARTSEEYEEVAQRLIAQIRQLEDILNTLLVISDLRESTQTVAVYRMDELIWQIIEKISSLYPHSRVLVNVDIPPEDERLLSVQTDSTQLLMALFNLIENAVKYSGGKTVDIHLSKYEEKLCVSITDKGIGIPADQLDSISKPFYRANNAHTMQGSGIGLSIALRILEKNKIEYRINSTEHQGTQVFLLF